MRRRRVLACAHCALLFVRATRSIECACARARSLKLLDASFVLALNCCAKLAGAVRRRTHVFALEYSPDFCAPLLANARALSAAKAVLFARARLCIKDTSARLGVTPPLRTFRIASQSFSSYF